MRQRVPLLHGTIKKHGPTARAERVGDPDLKAAKLEDTAADHARLRPAQLIALFAEQPDQGVGFVATPLLQGIEELPHRDVAVLYSSIRHSAIVHSLVGRTITEE